MLGELLTCRSVANALLFTCSKEKNRIHIKDIRKKYLTQKHINFFHINNQTG